MVINTNIAAQTGSRLLADSSANLAKSLARLSSGSKIVNIEDDAAGTAVSSRFDAQISRNSAANTNVGNAISFSQTQDGFLKKVTSALNRMGELAVLAQDVTKSSTDLALYQKEFTSLNQFVTDATSKTFNGIPLFGAATGAAVTTGSEGGVNDSFTMVAIGTASFNPASTDITTAAAAKTAQTDVIAAQEVVAGDRGSIGANISALNSYSGQLSVLKDNLSAANSRIKDVDVAEESANFAKYNILVQAGTAMLAQANQTGQSALKLLQ